MKNLSILALTATLVIAPAFAETTTITTANNNVAIPTTIEVVAITTEAPNQNLSFAFDNAENIQAVAMTDEQMADTQGAVAPLAAYGIRMGVMGTVGAVGNTWNHYNNTGQFSWGAAGRGFVIGAVGGGVSKYLGGKGL